MLIADGDDEGAWEMDDIAASPVVNQDGEGMDIKVGTPNPLACRSVLTSNADQIPSFQALRHKSAISRMNNFDDTQGYIRPNFSIREF